MDRRIWKRVVTFLLVLVLTAATVTTLSMATSAKADTASARYSQQVREAQAPQATELSAAVPEEGVSPAVGVAAFGLILAATAAGFLLFRKGKKQPQRSNRRYVPRADMTFRSVRSRV